MSTAALGSALKEKVNKVFLRRFYNTTQTTSKAERKRILNSGTKAQRVLLCKLLNLVLNGTIPLREKHFPAIVSSRKFSFLKKHFQSKEGLKEIIQGGDSEIKEKLAQINCFHLLLANLFT
jgi:hypothetical protein